MALTRNLATALAFTIGVGVPGWGQEGEVSDNPDDPGGFTWRGITLANWRTWTQNPDATPSELTHATEDQIIAFYAANYFNRVQGDSLPAGVSLSVFDMGVNAGTYASAVILQRAIGFTGGDVDGWIGPQTLGETANHAPDALVDTLTAAQLAFYQSLAGWDTFGDGWTNRVNARQTAALTALGLIGMQA